MLKKKKFKVNNKEYTHTYSDTGMYITYDDVLYPEAIFPSEQNHIYGQTRIPIKSVCCEAMMSEIDLFCLIEKLRAQNDLFKTKDCLCKALSVLEVDKDGEAFPYL